MQARPIFASNIEAAKDKVTNAISAYIHPSINSLREQLKRERALLEEEREAVLAQCTNW
jgi:hypothetical protein